RDQWAKRAGLLARLRVPEEAIVLARAADEPRGELADSVSIPVLRVVLALRVDVGQAHLDGAELVLADPSVENLVLAGRRVEAPDGSVWHERNGKREIVRAHIEDQLATSTREAVSLRILGHETLPRVAIGDPVARVDEALAVRPQDGQQRFLVVALDGL